MTETQAQSGAAGTSTQPADTPRNEPAGTPTGDNAKSTGRAAVGRATVAGDGKPSSSDQVAPSGVAATSKPATAGASGTGQPASTAKDAAGSPDAPAKSTASGKPGKDQPGKPETEPGAADRTAGSATSGAAGRAAGTGKSGADSDPADNPAQTTRFTRAPGMPPPPESAADADERTRNLGSASIADARGSGVGTGRATVKPAAAESPTSSGPGLRAGGGVTGIGRASVPTAAPGSRGTATAPAGRIGSAATVGPARAETGRGRTMPGAAQRGPRRARLYLKRIDPWSVMKFSFAVSFVLLVVAVVATSVLYLALDAMGVFKSVNRALSDMVSATGSDSTTFKITAKGVIFGSTLLGAINVVLFTALATLGAFIYNVCADLVGGVELTLAEKD